MEKVIELLLALLWDLGKTVILQWIVNQIKEWWPTRKNVGISQYA